MRQQIETDAEPFPRGRGVEDARANAGAVQGERQRQPADAAADDDDVMHASASIPKLAIPGGTLSRELRNRKGTSHSIVLVRFCI